MQRLIVTGANGTGKSFVAARMSAARPAIPLVSFDAIKLMSDWQQRPRPEIDRDLSQLVATDAWILEGGPSLLPLALPQADAVLWLDPPELVRAWRLMVRPWRNIGKPRQELPEGNREWPLQQYRFVLRSLKNGSRLRSSIKTCLEGAANQRIWHCRNQRDIETAFHEWHASD
ncbi:DNA topology modulation protein FlaR [Pseudovibrio ascidiaceicola]|uniref:DNA topology modulation protein FlaR n=1 Tax=Pseudovibrio ascidiaceicola TaxID=285279 RepID=UPI003D368710